MDAAVDLLEEDSKKKYANQNIHIWHCGAGAKCEKTGIMQSWKQANWYSNLQYLNGLDITKSESESSDRRM